MHVSAHCKSVTAGLRPPAGSAPHLQLICIIKVDFDSGNHPSVEQRGQDVLSNGVCDEMKMQWVPPVGTEDRVASPSAPQEYLNHTDGL